MASLTESRELPLWSDHLRFVWRQRVLVGALTLIGLVAGAGWASFQHPAYAATASVTLSPVPKYVLPTGDGLLPPAVTIDTDAQLLYSPVVLDAVAEALGVPAGTAMDHLSVTATANSHVLHVTATGRTSEGAAAAANAAVAGLARVRRDTLGSLRLDQLRLLRLWTAGQEKALAQAQSSRVVIPDADDLFTTVVELQTSLRELEEARATPAIVIDPAVPPRRTVRSNAEVPLTSGLMLGALLGCLAGIASERAAARGRPSVQARLLPLLQPVLVRLRPSALTTQG